MPKYGKVAQALVAAGYLTEADIDAAADLLAEVLIVDEAEAAIDAALEDEAYQEGVIAHAEQMAVEDAARGNLLGRQIDGDIKTAAEIQHVRDEKAITGKKEAIALACNDAAAALLAAELIHGADTDNVTRVIAGVLAMEIT